MRLANLKEFRSLIYTPDSAPSVSTLRGKIIAGKIPGGRVVDGRYYVDLDEFDRENHLVGDLLARRKALMESPELEGLI